MSSKIITDYYNPLLGKSSFIPVSCGERFSQSGKLLATLARNRRRVLLGLCAKGLV